MEKDEKVGGEREIQEIEGGGERKRLEAPYGQNREIFSLPEDRLSATKDEIQFSLTIQFFQCKF